MREFEYFLFENFDADAEAENPLNPRKFFGKETDAVLSWVAERPAGARDYAGCRDTFGASLVDRLTQAGFLRRSGAAVVFDCPLFLREDAALLRKEAAARSAALADLLTDRMADIRACCAGIQNGFSVERNLYHILCGMVFDGGFFDYLSEKGVLAVSRLHSSGLDYVSVIYEKCGELRKLSDGLLCSYNRLVNEICSLQSFGDAQGDRADFYRFFRQMEQNAVPAGLKDAEELLRENYGGADKNALLADAAALIRTGRRAPAARKLLERFGYLRNGKVCVPVYTPEHQRYIEKIEKIVESCLGEAISKVLADFGTVGEITAVKHGVDRLEIANEAYHMVFGFLNEELAARKLVAAPPAVSGEGRYFQCVELYR